MTTAGCPPSTPTAARSYACPPIPPNPPPLPPPSPPEPPPPEPEPPPPSPGSASPGVISAFPPTSWANSSLSSTLMTFSIRLM
ncbi:hypothetical protein EJB06_06595 [Massilia atriviolacea]|uniref:Uncharacterized protein n=1 Tax=Massilia atriviolacea TaxID=2495579 RepID=A0A430HQQ5_9BURK|nr:hypothetical protein EJB06_06595 [Massilia atriviolacea]